MIVLIIYDIFLSQQLYYRLKSLIKMGPSICNVSEIVWGAGGSILGTVGYMIGLYDINWVKTVINLITLYKHLHKKQS